jgi:hypothetical protein
MSDADILSELGLTLHTNSLGSEVAKKDVSIASSHHKGAAVSLIQESTMGDTKVLLKPNRSNKRRQYYSEPRLLNEAKPLRYELLIRFQALLFLGAVSNGSSKPRASTTYRRDPQ